jgi:broad specificity phosphatase PhoE
MQLFLIRHGQSLFNAHFAEHNRDPMIRDAELSEIGHAQVAAARARRHLLPTPDTVIASPLTRAIQTASGIFGPEKLELTALHRERVEHWCDVGHPPATLATRFPGLPVDHLDDPWWHHDPAEPEALTIESEDAVLARVEAFRAWLTARPEPVLAVIGHGVFFHHLTGRHFANCEIARINLADWTVAETF